MSGILCGLSKQPVSNAVPGASSIAPMDEPQVGQKARDERSEER
jgi:hypothetical protein